MPRIVDVASLSKDPQKTLARSLQSGHINFLIGSGASLPAIPLAGTAEREITTLYTNGNDEDARARLYTFLAAIQDPTNKLIAKTSDASIVQTLKQYQFFLETLEVILSERRTELLPKQASIFTTNYDLFIEKAALGLPSLILNDGFSRVPSLDGRVEFSSRTFFNTMHNTGNLYNYKVEVPSINLVKLHGSLSWRKDKEDVLFSVTARSLLAADRTAAQIRAFVEDYAVVLPEAAKFRTTLMNRTYYDLLRMYANALDRENCLLIVFGFSFGDEHLFDITRRALKNPTLKILAFAFDDATREDFQSKFEGHNNLDIVVPSAGAQLGWEDFNKALRGCLPSATETT